MPPNSESASWDQEGEKEREKKKGLEGKEM